MGAVQFERALYAPHRTAPLKKCPRCKCSPNIMVYALPYIAVRNGLRTPIITRSMCVIFSCAHIARTNMHNNNRKDSRAPEHIHSSQRVSFAASAFPHVFRSRIFVFWHCSRVFTRSIYSIIVVRTSSAELGGKYYPVCV